MTARYFILNEKREVVVVDDLMTWAEWFERFDNRIVGHTRFDPDILVSTVFLGLNHRFFGAGPPLIFETMVFGINVEDEAMTWRYSSWDDAETGHQATVHRVKDLLVKASREKARCGFV